jgi:hypothetical protein
VQVVELFSVCDFGVGADAVEVLGRFEPVPMLFNIGYSLLYPLRAGGV